MNNKPRCGFQVVRFGFATPSLPWLSPISEAATPLRLTLRATETQWPSSCRHVLGKLETLALACVLCRSRATSALFRPCCLLSRRGSEPDFFSLPTPKERDRVCKQITFWGLCFPHWKGLVLLAGGSPGTDPIQIGCMGLAESWTGTTKLLSANVGRAFLLHLRWNFPSTGAAHRVSPPPCQPLGCQASLSLVGDFLRTWMVVPLSSSHCTET